MGIRRDAGGDDGMLDAVDDFLLLRGLGGSGDEARARGHVNEDDGIVLGMKFLFHGSLVFATRSNARGGEIGGNRWGVKFLGFFCF